MALNERDNGASKAASIYPGSTSNPKVPEPTFGEKGTGTGAHLKGHRDDIKHAQRDAMHTRRASAGVVEGYPGIIESSHIEPLDEEYKEGAGRGRTMGRSIPTQGQGLKERLATAAEGAANIVYGVATGDHQATKAGKESLGFNQ
ncbi:hypothetical protein F5J12DRAFT_396887 [Pisolithus orientalis]|uniref:uncharacterized protein n=1 Tax=Pisolithus orientalis TaxID=936130 RepID=UPI0022241B5C|nr:uncharacterized protein F5J12DRAFT_396887 [Pisolithus orientalis]KAI6028825.1 hypothetical protein F5J12DRAFT_396887 [Pisolithus orientalis]